MASSTTQTALPTLPGELWDHIVDSLSLSSSGYCSNEDDTRLDALRALLHVSRSLRLRALFNLLRNLDLSPENGSSHLNKAAELLAMLNDDEGVHSLRAMPRELSLDLLGNMLSGWLDVLPRLAALRSLTIANGNLSGSGDAIAVESLVLDECNFDTAFIARFTSLRRLELINCRTIDNNGLLPFLPAQCELYLHSPCEDVLDWVAQHVDGFVLRSLALTSTSAPSVPMDVLHTLYLSAHNLDAEIGAIAKSTSLRRLELVAPSVPRALLLFKAVRIVTDSCAVVALDVPEDGPFDELSATLAKWKGVRELWVNGCLVQPAPASNPDAIPVAPTLEPVEVVRDVEQTVAVVENVDPYAPPFELGVSTERTVNAEDDEDEQDYRPTLRTNPYAPPFALGVSTKYAIVVQDEDEAYDEEIATVSALRNPYAPPFALGVSTATTPAQSDDEDDDSTTPSLTSDSGSELSSDAELDSDDEDDEGQEISFVFSRDAFKPPFALGVSRARVADDSEDDDGNVDLDMPTPRVDAYKPPFPLGVSTLPVDDNGDDEDVTVHF